MSVIAELRIRTSEFALGQTLEATPDVRVEFERVVTHSQEWIMPFLWVSGGDLDAFEQEIVRDPTVAESRIADRFDGVYFYQIRWSEDILALINGIFDQSGVLIEAAGSAKYWDVMVQFNDKRSLGELESSFNEGASAFTLERLYTPDKPRQVDFNLTAAQQDALVLAIERGFFDIPRTATLEELASELGITSTAVSERLRRAIVTLGRNTLTIDDNLD